MIEIDLNGSLLTFDGHVVEVFYWHKIVGNRRHVRHLTTASVNVDRKGRGVLEIVGVRPAGSVSLEPFPAERLDEARSFAETVQQAIDGCVTVKG